MTLDDLDAKKREAANLRREIRSLNAGVRGDVDDAANVAAHAALDEEITRLRAERDEAAKRAAIAANVATSDGSVASALSVMNAAAGVVASTTESTADSAQQPGQRNVKVGSGRKSDSGSDGGNK